MSIFISIASYCDPLCGFTMAQAYEKAKWPDELRFAVIDQSPMDAPSPVPAHIPARQVTYMKIDSKVTRGCAWARALAMSCYRDQDWYLQIDSHMMFDQDWDEILINKANACMHFVENCVLSSYPPGFAFTDGVAVPTSEPERLIATVVRPGTGFDRADSPFIEMHAKDIAEGGAVAGFHIAGGFIFASGDYVYKFPWDPFLYFNEEEQAMAIRLYTHGWEIFHVRGVPIYHLYNVAGEFAARPLIWEEKHDGKDQPLWQILTKRARRRMTTLFWGDSSELGVHGLGHERSLQDFAKLTGIDYPNRIIHPKAYTGDWDAPADEAVAEAVQGAAS